MHDKRNIAEMGGEALREAGILVLVFAPLYQLFEPYKPKWDIFCLVWIVGGFLLILGIEVERRRA